MHTETSKSLHLNIRISELSKNVLQRAAEIEGDTLSHFVLSQALESAYKRLSETQTVALNPQEQQQFFHLLENPPPINATFAQAIERYKRVKENGSEV
ncbi:MAG: DUF1778 domain-containing protein [Proteobacteria bacterium]|nr:DUF1778 domain-containing protein [Pseudomonadota bacterium]